MRQGTIIAACRGHAADGKWPATARVYALCVQGGLKSGTRNDIHVKLSMSNSSVKHKVAWQNLK